MKRDLDKIEAMKALYEWTCQFELDNIKLHEKIVGLSSLIETVT